MRKQKLIILILLVSISIYAQDQKKIEIINADYTYINNDLHPDYWRLVGNVNIKHNNTNMLCDSAYYYSSKERIEAFKNVKLFKGDSIQVVGNYLTYKGEESIAVISENVIFRHNTKTLNSDKITLNIKDDYAYYNTRSQIINLDENISSNIGEYNIKNEIYTFIDSVILITKDYSIKTNFLKYDIKNLKNYIQGPSKIIINDQIIYCEKGFFDNSNNKAEFYKNTKITNQEYSIKADSIFYNNISKHSIAKNNIQLRDSINNFILLGGLAEHYQKEKKLIIYDSPLLKLFSEKDTLFMSSKKFIYTYSHNNKILQSFNNVKFLNNEIKGRCDSLTYKISDSLISMFKKPIIWLDEYQVSSDSIDISYFNKSINRIFINSKPMIISKEDSLSFNQIKGNKMTCYFKKNKLSHLDVNGNGQSIYFLKDNTKKIGMNYIESSNISIKFQDNRIDQINYEIIPLSITTPYGDIKLKDRYLDGFNWRNNEKPKNKKELITE